MSTNVEDAPASGADATGTSTRQKSWYKHYVLVILALIYASSFMDRQITAILIEDLKAEFDLSDSQLGFLSGLAFAVFYATLGIPIARLADKFRRVTIIGVAVTVWSAMTALSGAAVTYTQLLLARIGVGVGEAGGGPPSHSIISDLYEAKHRSMALSIWSMGIIIGGLAGVMGGGWIAEHYGWRMAFYCAGIPGLVLAVLVFFTLREPERGASETPDIEHEEGDEESLSFKDTLVYLWHNRVYRYACGAHVLAVFFGYSLSAWLPAFFLRNWEVGQAEVGAIAGLITVAGGGVGMLSGGIVASALVARRNAAWDAWVPALGLVLAMPAAFVAFFNGSLALSAFMLGVTLFGYQIAHGPGLAVVQTSVSPNKRATAAAVMYFISNMLGLGTGPVIVGFFSDMQLGATPGKSLAIAMCVPIIGLVLSVLGYWKLGYMLRHKFHQD